MPASNYAAIRYRIINSCFTSRTKKYWTIEEVLEKLLENDINITRRTLERDFEIMRHDDRLKYYAPIAYDKSRKVFYYEDPTYTTTSVLLAGEDVLVLQEGERMLRDISFLQEFIAALQKVIGQIGGKQVEDPRSVERFRDCGNELVKLVIQRSQDAG